ncbi:MAG: DUF1598 domain-containing protein [Pirellulales bacterium]|nr:DUF1598 domain-containing protein [Pirellulales bacterium]
MVGARLSAFGCSIVPSEAALADTQAFLQTQGARPLEPSERGEWLQRLRDTLGKQDVEFFGMAPNSHVAKTLLLADYHMKLIGMGLVDGLERVTSYLAMVRLGPNGEPPLMSVLRWWFAMHYEPVETNSERDVFCIRGPGAKVLSENELLTARGERIHTGTSDERNACFANSFSAKFETLCERYPLYGELRNIFDLALVVNLIEREGLTERVGWRPDLFADGTRLCLPQVQ